MAGRPLQATRVTQVHSGGVSPQGPRALAAQPQPAGRVVWHAPAAAAAGAAQCWAPQGAGLAPATAAGAPYGLLPAGHGHGPVTTVLLRPSFVHAAPLPPASPLARAVAARQLQPHLQGGAPANLVCASQVQRGQPQVLPLQSSVRAVVSTVNTPQATVAWVEADGKEEGPAQVQPTLQAEDTLPPVGAARDIKQVTLALNNPNLLHYYAGALFRRNDVNGDGVLSIAELERLIPELHAELGLDPMEPGKDGSNLVRSRMRKFDTNGDGVLGEQEFVELYRWSLWRRHEDLNPPRFRRGDIIGHAHKGIPAQFYSLGKQLGAGSFGIVHRVAQLGTGVEHVMKTINKDKVIESGTPLALLTQEVDLLAMLDHPNILRLFEWYNDTQNIYLILDECAGGELLDLITNSAAKQWPLPEVWVAKIFRQSLEAIGYCHAKGVMHKDLKFENIMLRQKLVPASRLEDVAAVIIDVGLAELFGPEHGKQSRSSLRAGSLATMAPEVLQGDFSYKCDIWSLGCMLFALYNAQPFYIPDGRGGQVLYMYPFYPSATEADPMGVAALLAAQQAGPPMDLLPAASRAVRDLVFAMLQFREQMRPNAHGCLASAWFAGAPSEGGVTVAFARENLESLMQERDHRLWWRAATIEAASQLPAAKVEPLARLFRSMDTNADGFIDKHELCGGLQRLGVPREVGEKAADAADFDGNGKIEWSEFLANCLPASRELFAASLQVAFQAFDHDGDGAIDGQEVLELLESGRIDGMHMPTSKTVDTMLRELDLDRDGKISFAEFHDYFIHADLDGLA